MVAAAGFHKCRQVTYVNRLYQFYGMSLKTFSAVNHNERCTQWDRYLLISVNTTPSYPMVFVRKINTNERSYVNWI